MSAHAAPLDVSVAVGLDRLPDAIRSATTLDRIDYVDHVALVTADARRRTPEQWARTTIEETPLARRAARRLWRTLGLRLAPPTSRPPVSVAHRRAAPVLLRQAVDLLHGEVDR